MSHVPAELHYTKDHEWVRIANDGTATIGITDHAQAALGDVTFVDLPKKGKTFAAGEVFGTVESVKAASDLYSPISGEVIEVNQTLNDTPDLVNREPYAGAWMIRVRVQNSAELSALLNAAGYSALL